VLKKAPKLTQTGKQSAELKAKREKSEKLARGISPPASVPREEPQAGQPGRVLPVSG